MSSRRVFLAATAVLSAMTVRPARAQFGQTITSVTTIGVVAPFTGDRSHEGEQLANGVRQAVDDANQIRTLLDRGFAMRTYDDEDMLAEAVVTAQFACDDPAVVCVIGHLSGHSTQAALSTYAVRGMPLIVPVSSFDGVTARGYGNLIRLPTKDSAEGRLAAKYVNATVKPAVVANVFLDGDYGFDVANGFDQQMGLDKVACKTLKFPFAKTDFPALAAATLANKPNAIFLAGLAGQLGPAIGALRQAGYTGPLFGSQGLWDAATIKSAGAAADGLTVSSSMPPLALAPGALRYVSSFGSRYGPMTPISAFGYAAAQIAIDAIHHCDGTRAGLVRTLGLRPYDTVVGPLQFGPYGDPIDPNLYFYEVRDGAWSYVRASHSSGFLIK